MQEVVRVYEGGKGRDSSNLVAVPDSRRLTDKKILTFFGAKNERFHANQRSDEVVLYWRRQRLKKGGQRKQPDFSFCVLR